MAALAPVHGGLHSASGSGGERGSMGSHGSLRPAAELQRDLGALKKELREAQRQADAEMQLNEALREQAFSFFFLFFFWITPQSLLHFLSFSP